MKAFRKVLANIIGVMFGLIFASIMIGAMLFADGGDLEERSFSFIIVFLIYLVVGLGTALIHRDSRAFIPLSIPAILISLSIYGLEGANNNTELSLFFIYPLLALVGSFLPFLVIRILSHTVKKV